MMVKSLTGRTGKPLKNAHVIRYNSRREYLQSYDTVVAEVIHDTVNGGGIIRVSEAFYSKTTSRHINAFIKLYEGYTVEKIPQSYFCRENEE